ncbi:MAG: HPr family phosphocarrier protein [Eubacterium sp.]|nr:HPr family phosphocarrier protein [Eubacterium sp.]
MIQKEVTVNILDGKEERPIAVMVQLAGEFQSRIYFESDNRKVNAKSIMGMMTLGLYPGEPINITIEGDDEEEAMEKIEKYLTTGAQ